MVSLRPVGGHDALRRAVAREGGTLVALSPWKLVARDDPATRTRLGEALRGERVVFTSPMAVRSAAALATLTQRRGQQWFGVGSGTARALQRAGVRTVASPARMDSEGLLALPGLQALEDAPVGLVTAPGGRGCIEATLLRRGARLQRADVYERVAVMPSPHSIARLLAARGRTWLALSSAGALAQVLASLPDRARDALVRARACAASERLAALAAEAGFAHVVVARSARPADMVAAMLDKRRPRR